MEEKSLIQEISVPIYMAKGWMKFIGVMSIIYGILMIITIFGIIFCWLPIWIGILLFGAGSKIEYAQTTGDKQQLIESLSKIKTYFTITGIVMLIGIIVGVLSLLVFGSAFFAALENFRY